MTEAIVLAYVLRASSETINEQCPNHYACHCWD